MPVGLTYALLTVVAPLLARLSPKRHAVRANVARASGHVLDDRRVDRLVSEVFTTSAHNYFDLLRLPARSARDLAESIEFDDPQAILGPLSRGKGVIVINGHIGGFDVGLHSPKLDIGVQRGILVEPLEPPELFEFVSRLRSRTGVEMVPVSTSGLRRIMDILRGNGLIAFAMDRDIQGNGVEVSFFGAPARLPMGVASIAVRTGAALVPATSYRVGGARVRMSVREPLYADPTLSRADAERDIFERLVHEIEELIKPAPGQWVVFEPIWPAEYPVAGAAKHPPETQRTADAR